MVQHIWVFVLALLVTVVMVFTTPHTGGRTKRGGL